MIYVVKFVIFLTSFHANKMRHTYTLLEVDISYLENASHATFRVVVYFQFFSDIYLRANLCMVYSIFVRAKTGGVGRKQKE